MLNCMRHGELIHYYSKPNIYIMLIQSMITNKKHLFIKLSFAYLYTYLMTTFCNNCKTYISIKVTHGILTYYLTYTKVLIDTILIFQLII